MTLLPPRPTPRFVPTLTEVVHAPAAGFSGPAPQPPQPQPQPHAVATAPGSQDGRLWSPGELEEQIVHRVMQRVDVSLDLRLREAIAAVVQEQTRGVVPRLREEIESIVRQSVYEAVADELTADATRPPR